MSALLAASNGYEAPGTEIFWQPLFGSGQWAVTRASVVALLSVGFHLTDLTRHYRSLYACRVSSRTMIVRWISLVPS